MVKASVFPKLRKSYPWPVFAQENFHAAQMVPEHSSAQSCRQFTKKKNIDETCFAPDPAYYERFKAKSTGMPVLLSFIISYCGLDSTRSNEKGKNLSSTLCFFYHRIHSLFLHLK